MHLKNKLYLSSQVFMDTITNSENNNSEKEETQMQIYNQNIGKTIIGGINC